MFFFLLITQFIMSPSASAGECEAQLKKILANAKVSVISQFEKGSPCHTSALIGRKNGPPGCNPPVVFQLKALLTPAVTSARGVCSKACAAEAKTTSCNALLSTSQLRERGIEGLEQILKTDLPIGAAFVEESMPVLPGTVEI